jgi:hypothetical protein
MFGKKNALIVVFADHLEIFLPSSLVFNFSSSFVFNMELLDRINFEKSLKIFLEQNKIYRKNFFLILDESFLFWKKEEKKEEVEDKNEVSFFEMVPLPSEQKEEISFSLDKEKIFISYNKSILESIVRVFLSKKNQIKGIYPFFAVNGDFSNQKITPFSFDEKKIRKNFLIDLPIQVEKKDGKKILIAFLLSLIIFLTFGIFLLKNKFIFKKEKKSFNLPVEKPTPILSPTPTIFYLSPENIDIEIQNGSLRPGEAKKLKEKLEEKGYKILKIGNAQEKTEITKIFIKKNIPQEFIASLSAILKESYSLATQESNLDYFNSSDSADILIVIGEK